MQYRTFNKTGEKVSLLGMGTMRLPINKDETINEKEAISIIRHAIDQGVNYMDTAYPYHNGQSEIVLGKALKDGYREKVFIADKMPTWLARSKEDVEKMFNEQLERLDVDCIDMYLVHNITKPMWKIIKKHDVIPFLEKMKSDGRIKHLGFSFHDTYDFFEEVVDFYPWDFCQIQLNYMDINFQAGVKGLKYASDKGIPVIVMEPLKGGKLTDSVPDSINEIWKKSEVEKTPAQWAFEWVANFPEVLTILSGMSTQEQLDENLKILNNAKPNSLSKSELSLIEEVSNKYNELIQYSCTNCRYCMPCPQKVNIPKCIDFLNEWSLYNQNPKTKMEYTDWFVKEQHAINCIDCKECEDKCPQSLNISEAMKKTANLFD